MSALPVPTSGASLTQASFGNKRLVLQNRGTASVFWDTVSPVTTDTGMEIPAGWTYEFPSVVAVNSGTIYFVAASGTQDLRWAAI